MRTAILTLSLFTLAFVVALDTGFTAPSTVPPRLTLQDPGARDEDDMAFWVHPTDLSLSTIIASDKAANRLFVYDLKGRTLQSIEARQPGNIDSRHGFRLGAESVDIVAFNERGTNRIRVFKVNRTTRLLEQIDDGSIDSGASLGFSLYRSAATGRIYAFTSGPVSSLPWRHDFLVRQLELVDTGYGKVSATAPLRRLAFGNTVEGMVADDEQGKLFLSEEPVGIWKFDAEPNGAASGAKIALVGEHGLAADVEGLTMYYMAGGGGYLIASSQGNSAFQVYDRSAPHVFRGSFTVDGVRRTDGIGVVSLPLNADFPGGLFATHNGSAKGPFPIQLAKWDDIANALGLSIDVAYWDPRKGTANGTPAMLAKGGTGAPGRNGAMPAAGEGIDRTPPVVTAALVAAGKVKDDEGHFQVQAACNDDGHDPRVVTRAELNGFPVIHGQAVKLEIDDDEIKIKKGDTGILKMKAPAFQLVVDCKDAAGNLRNAVATPPFARSRLDFGSFLPSGFTLK